MRPNRSTPAATVIPVLIYPDVRAAVAWLSEAFGFTERVRIGENHRSQLNVGEGGAAIVGDVRHDRRPPRAGEVTQSVTVRVEDVRAHCERARDARRADPHGADRLRVRRGQYEAEDFAGHRWTFSETLDDVAPEE